MSLPHRTARFVGREVVRSSRGTGLFVLALILVVVVGAVSDLPQARRPRAVATGALTPAMQAATWIDGALNGAATWFAGNRQDADQNRRLEEENRRLAAQLAALQATERQNAQLRAELGLRRQDHLLTTGAAVVARDPDGLDRTFTIDAGSDAGVKPGMAVIAGAGLVGLVRSVTARSAQVLTTAAPTFSIAVITGSTGLGGTARGGPDGISVRLATSGESQPQPGEGVVTAGAGAIPPGLAVGRLTTISIGGGQAARQMATGLVTPFSDPVQADQVLVVRAVGG